MVQQLIHSLERKDLPFLTKFLLHIMKPGALSAVTWYDVSSHDAISIVNVVILLTPLFLFLLPFFFFPNYYHDHN